MRDVSNWKAIGGQAGSTPGGLYADEHGQRWYVKTPLSAGHALSELLANRLYRLAGTPVPELELVCRGGASAVASAVVSGLTLGEVLSFPNHAAVAALRRDFAVDAWLGNRDVVGVDLDNVLVTRAGAAVRIDQGGALQYRAQGAAKTDFGRAVLEFDSLRDPRRNAAAASVFGAMTPQELAASVAKVARLDAAAIAATVHAVHGHTPSAQRLIELLIGRRDDLAQRMLAITAAAGVTPLRG